MNKINVIKLIRRTASDDQKNQAETQADMLINSKRNQMLNKRIFAGGEEEPEPTVVEKI